MWPAFKAIFKQSKDVSLIYSRDCTQSAAVLCLFVMTNSRTAEHARCCQNGNYAYNDTSTHGDYNQSEIKIYLF